VSGWRVALPFCSYIPWVAVWKLHKRGAQKAPTKVLVSLRLERDVVARLRASGRGWQSRANDMLRKAVLGS
jgi:uncharacterized protein (DUF4415 family)